MLLCTYYNLEEACIVDELSEDDKLSKALRKMVPQLNKALTSYYNTKKLTQMLELPV